MLNTDIPQSVAQCSTGCDLIQFVQAQTVEVGLRVSRECVVETKMRVICFTHNTDAGSSEILPGMTPNFKHICKLMVNCLKL